MPLLSLSSLKNWRSVSLFERKFFSRGVVVRCFYCGPGADQAIYLGIRVSKKVGKATQRNVVKRRLRSLARDSFLAGNLSFKCVYLVSVFNNSSITYQDLKRILSTSLAYLNREVRVSIP